MPTTQPPPRLFLCARCRSAVTICSHCDRGQRYCSADCSRLARSCAQRAAAKRYQDICEIWGMEASRTCMTGFCMTDTVLPSSFSSISFLADKKGRGNPQFISQTLKLARHLLPFVKERLASDSSLTLSAAVVAAEAEQLAAFRAKSLNNLHDICSASDGGLGKKRRRGVPGGRGEGAGDED